MKALKRKNILALTSLLASTLMMSFVPVKAQENPSFKLKGGLNVSNFWVSDINDKNARVGFHAGGAMHYPITNLVGIQPELIFTTKGNTTSYEFLGFTGESTVNLEYLDVPISLVIHLGEYVNLNAGVYGGYLLNASVTEEGDFGNDTDPIDEDEFEKIDYGLLGGIELEKDNLGLGFRYNYGLQGVGKSGNTEEVFGDAKNSVLQAYVYFKL